MNPINGGAEMLQAWEGQTLASISRSSLFLRMTPSVSFVNSMSGIGFAVLSFWAMAELAHLKTDKCLATHPSTPVSETLPEATPSRNS